MCLNFLFICDLVKVLEVLQPFVALLPEVSKPERKVRREFCVDVLLIIDYSHSRRSIALCDYFRSSLKKRCYGLQSHSLSFLFVVRCVSVSIIP